jgi:hypothetical protein
VNISAFPGSLEDRGDVWTAISTAGNPSGSGRRSAISRKPSGTSPWDGDNARIAVTFRFRQRRGCRHLPISATSGV